MIKLSDIIKSGGGNAKINRFINKYVLSKKEKKDIIDEIKIKGSSSGGSSSKYAPRYFSIDWSKCSESWKYIVSAEDIDGIIYADTVGFVATVKVNIDGSYTISSLNANQYNQVIAFSYLPVLVSNNIKEALGIQHQMPFNVNDLIEVINKLIIELFNWDIAPISMEGITEITEEEYYKID